MSRPLALIFLLVVALRLPFLNQPIQGDDPYYLYGAEHAQIEPLHPKHTQYAFQGDMVDMRGHPHGPGNPWILGGLLATFGDVREVPFHAFYIFFSLLAVAAMWSLARRFSDSPVAATLLFVASPAFVVNGNSLEADLPFVALWLMAIASFVLAVDRKSSLWLAASCAAAALASLTAYQAIFLTPILACYVWQARRSWPAGWLATLAAPLTVGVWQLWERASSGALPAAVLAGYLQTYGYQVLAIKLRSALALLVHLGWVVSPIAIVAAFRRDSSALLAGLLGGLVAAFFNLNPLFWIPVACGAMVLGSLLRTALQGDFLAQWGAIFFAGALVIFFAGSARYLLPLAAPVAILVARTAPQRAVFVGIATHLVLGLLLAAANYQHWDGYRLFARSLATEAASKRVWISAEWGLRHYLEAEGALPLLKEQNLLAGEIIVTSQLAGAVPFTAPTALLRQFDIVPSIPLRLISLTGASAYSSAAGGFLPFEISRGPADRLRADVVLERQAELSYLDPKDPKARQQILAGLSSDGWMLGEASVLVKTPPKSGSVRVEIFIPPDAPARKVTLKAGGEVVAQDTFSRPGAYALAAPYSPKLPTVTLTVSVDKTHRVAGDIRELGVVVIGIGLR